MPQGFRGRPRVLGEDAGRLVESLCNMRGRLCGFLPGEIEAGSFELADFARYRLVFLRLACLALEA